MKTVLITGTSTGIGHAAAELFAKSGWTVFAGSRNPDELRFANEKILPTKIEVNEPASVAHCFEEIRGRGVQLDCVINNAGYGLLLPFEDTTLEEAQTMFRCNVFGLMEVCRRAAKHMRDNRSGTIINVSSVIGQVGAPFYTVYAASKFAVEGFSESLYHEMKPFDVHVKIVEPGATRSEFHNTAYDIGDREITPEYRDIYEKKKQTHDRSAASYTPAIEVAKVLYSAATDGSWRLRYPVGRQTRVTIRGKRWLPEQYFLQKLNEKFVGDWGK